MACVLVVGCGGGSGSGGGVGVPSAPVTRAGETEVWSSVLTSRVWGQIKDGAIRVHVGRRTVVPPCALDAARLRAGLPGVRADTVADFLARMREPGALGGQVRSIFRIVLLEPDEVAVLADAPIWKRHPDSAGLVELSRVGLGQGGDDALVYFRERSSVGYVIHLRRTHQWLEQTLMECARAP